MFCKICGAPIKDDGAFCPNCGAPAPRPPAEPAPPVNPGPTPDPRAYRNAPAARPPYQAAPGYPANGGAQPRPVYQPAAYPAQPAPAESEENSGKGLKIALIAVGSLIAVTAAVIAVLYFTGVIGSFGKPKETHGEAEAVTEPASADSPASEEATEEPSTEEPATLAPPPVMDAYTPGYYFIPTYDLRLRPNHNTSQNALTKIAQNATVYITEVWENTAAPAKDQHWWGKTSYNGYTGWISLYYASPTEPEPYTYEDDSYVNALWQRLDGKTLYSENKAQTLRFSFSGGTPVLSAGPAGKTATFTGTLNGHVTGNIDGVFEMPVLVNGRNQTILVDMTEGYNDRVVIRWADGTWTDYGY
ncbi:MAG: hypothetical protein IK104_10635 [Clostridia bacterium]|nr:hypothetical protein [Clostridia bacterium]